MSGEVPTLDQLLALALAKAPVGVLGGGERRRSRDRRSGIERRQQPANPLRSGALELIEDGLYADLATCASSARTKEPRSAIRDRSANCFAG